MTKDEIIACLDELREKSLLTENEYKDAVSLANNESISADGSDHLKGTINRLHTVKLINDDVFNFFFELIMELNRKKMSSGPSNKITGQPKLNAVNTTTDKVASRKDEQKNITNLDLQKEKKAIINIIDNRHINFEMLITLILSFVLAVLVSDDAINFFINDNEIMAVECILSVFGLIAIIVISLISLRKKLPFSIIIQCIISGLLALRYSFLFSYKLDENWPSILIIIGCLISLGLGVFAQIGKSDTCKIYSLVIFIVTVIFACNYAVGFTEKDFIVNEVLETFVNLTPKRDILFYSAMSLALLPDYI